MAESSKTFPKKTADKIGVKTLEYKLGFSEKIYYLELLRGLGITSKHFLRNLFGRKDIVTIEYPDVKMPYPPRFRSRHRLMKREDGRVRCVACMCCPTICPANCITIVAAETDDTNIEKYPVTFNIDTLKCIYCGLCVEACPCDAIRMDIPHHPEPVFSREDGILTLQKMLADGDISIARQGGVYGSRSKN